MRSMAALPKAIAEHLEEIRGLCVEHHVQKLSLVDAEPDEVFDFVVEFSDEDDPLLRGRRYREVWRGLRHMTGRDINLIVPHVLSGHRRREAELPRYDIYAAA
jgi:hypothetical protein